MMASRERKRRERLICRTRIRDHLSGNRQFRHENVLNGMRSGPCKRIIGSMKKSSQGSISGRRSRHAVSAGHQGHSEGNADRRRPAGHPVCGRRGARGRHRAFHLRDRPQQGGHRRPFRRPVRALRHAGPARQGRPARPAAAAAAAGRADQLHPPAGAARAWPCRLVRARTGRRRAVRAAFCPT